MRTHKRFDCYIIEPSLPSIIWVIGMILLLCGIAAQKAVFTVLAVCFFFACSYIIYLRRRRDRLRLDNRTWPQRVLGYCPYCGRYFCRVRTTRQNTAYVDDEQNWFTGCRECEKENDARWAEAWEEYYGEQGIYLGYVSGGCVSATVNIRGADIAGASIEYRSNQEEKQ